MTERPRPSPQRRGAPVIARVLDLALEELARVGFHRLSVPELAARAGLNKTSVYRRWPTKEALVAAALERAMGHDAPLPESGSLQPDLEAFVLGAAAWASSPVGRAALKALFADGDGPEVRALVTRLARPGGAGPHGIFARAIARGELGKDADFEMAMSVVAGALAHRILVEGEPVTPTYVSRLLRFVVAGLEARSV